MKKLDNFSRCLDVLRHANFEFAKENEIYRTGIVWQFNLTLELAWKLGFLNDSAVWMLMLKKRNVLVHLYKEDDIDEMILLVRDSFIPAFSALEKTLREKLAEVRADWE